MIEHLTTNQKALHPIFYIQIGRLFFKPVTNLKFEADFLENENAVVGAVVAVLASCNASTEDTSGLSTISVSEFDADYDCLELSVFSTLEVIRIEKGRLDPMHLPTSVDVRV